MTTTPDTPDPDKAVRLVYEHLLSVDHDPDVAEQDAADLVEIVRRTDDTNGWIRMYLDSAKWGVDLITVVLNKAAEGGTPVEVLEVVADYADGRDIIDDELVALFVKGRDHLARYVVEQQTPGQASSAETGR